MGVGEAAIAALIAALAASMAFFQSSDSWVTSASPRGRATRTGWAREGRQRAWERRSLREGVMAGKDESKGGGCVL